MMRVLDIMDGYNWRPPDFNSPALQEIWAELPSVSRIFSRQNDRIIWAATSCGKFSTKKKLPGSPLGLNSPRHGVLHLDHCVLCQDAQVETIHHLFVDCEYSQRIWVHILGKNRLKFPRVLNWGQAKHWFCAHFRGNDLVGRIRAELKIPAVTYHKWEPPPLGTVAVNCDGSLRNRLGVSGYVLRKNFMNVLQEKSN
ncbi:unnamed protein product [Fraxinus pennsylvanica]|uniref:Reverse transcriptase zinc-binding domain-containing protein n=1 Tax=Fraxinus pennsylvanica TaxID=56036 RepID=A0AAD1ZU23_9LAMI|nr:unnamed protein product [Fraxinus pennsylvanica]